MLLRDLILNIDLNALVANYRIVKSVASTAECAAVVKANAYGLGLKPVTMALAKAGCKTFFVATIEEAIELREYLPDSVIAWFHGCNNREQLDVAKKYRLIPVINTLESLKLMGDIPYMLHIDTGMNRLGISTEEIKNLTLPNQLMLVMTHPACADNVTDPLNTIQYNIFKECVARFPQVRLSYANSSAIFLSNKYHFDLVRAGASLYGINPLPDSLNPMKPVVTLHAKIIQIRQIDTPSTVGYGALQEIPKGSILATITCGYADGYMRQASFKAQAAIGTQRFPIVGRISMDLIVVDVTQAQIPVQVGDYVELLGATITVDEMAGHAGTIGYEVLTRLGHRCYRSYQE